MHIRLSIIIPVYNVESYLRSCIESCISNDLYNQEYEIIAVNDGSRDNSKSILEEYQQSYNILKVISQENQGLSVARNTGLGIAKGDYIWFVDSDDWIDESAINLVISKIKKNNLDIIKLRAWDIFPDGNKRIRHSEYDENIIQDGRTYALTNLGNTPVQFSIYRKKLLTDNNLQFLPGVFHEDNEFTPRVYWYAKKVGFINKPLYYYRQNPASITKTINPKKSYDLIKVCQSLSNFTDTIVKNQDLKFKNALNSFISLSLNNAIFNILKSNKEEQQKFNRTLYNNKYLFKHLLKSKDLKYNIEGFLWSIFKDYTFIYKLLKSIK